MQDNFGDEQEYYVIQLLVYIGFNCKSPPRTELFLFMYTSYSIEK